MDRGQHFSRYIVGQFPYILTVIPHGVSGKKWLSFTVISLGDGEIEGLHIYNLETKQRSQFFHAIPSSEIFRYKFQLAAHLPSYITFVSFNRRRTAQRLFGPSATALPFNFA